MFETFFFAESLKGIGMVMRLFLEGFLLAFEE